MRYTAHSPQETQAIAQELADRLARGDIVLLRGDLGAGKTAFVRGLAHGLGCQSPVSSPTFALMHRYDGGRLPLYHFDLYRLSSADEAEEIGLMDVTADGVAAVEWPDVAEALFPQNAISVTLSLGEEDDEREIVIENLTDAKEPQI